MKQVGGTKFIKWETGKVIEGQYLDGNEKPNPFDDTKGTLVDYTIKVGEEEQVLSSGSDFLKKNLWQLKTGTPIKIEMCQVGAKKIYKLFV